ncbi:flagellum-specific ATP synthase FliI [Chromatiales bacterium (ex Bugula neritina AB1)]|nr:flagellum-specific ATP synthase FliI [Chromatiales bacterium (ex Bugula neritina AB1)]
MDLEPLNNLRSRLSQTIESVDTLEQNGRISKIVGTIVHAISPDATLGEICLLRDAETGVEMYSEVIGFSEEMALLTPFGDIRGLSSRTEVIRTRNAQIVAVGQDLLGRVLNGFGEVRYDDPRGPLKVEDHYSMIRTPPDPMQRPTIDRVLPVGIRSIDTLLTCAEGQRLGIFSAAGGGKSTLLGSIARGTSADVIVIGLIGERGREVRDFIYQNIGEEGMQRTVVVASPSNKPAMERIKAAHAATTIAEYFADQGNRVLLLMDSVTRFARALREVGLAAGEPATRRGFPPSVFAAMPQLVERAGKFNTGSITAFYTVLVEGDDLDEPVADEMRSLVDGHIVLSKKLSQQGNFPPVDILKSDSRIMGAVISNEHADAAIHFKRLLSKYDEIELLLKVGEYANGSDPLADEAISKRQHIMNFLKQPVSDIYSFEHSLNDLMQLQK